jgi:hypothetical protein
MAARWLVTILAVGAVLGLFRFRRKRPLIAFLAVYLGLVLIRVWLSASNGLVAATAGGNVAMVRLCLWLGCDPDSREWSLTSGHGGTAVTYGRIPLTAGHDPRIVRLLLDYGASPNAKDAMGWTPLLFAMRFDVPLGGHGDENAVALLLDRGADPNDQGGTPPLLFASHPAIVRLLVEHGASVDSPETIPLLKATYEGNAEVVAFLLGRGASVAATYSKQSALWSLGIGPAGGCEGWTALHFAAHGNSRRVGELLLDHGADVNARDGRGMTPLAVAQQFKRTELELLLRSRGGKAS